MHALMKPIQDRIDKADDEIKKLKKLKDGVDWVLLRVESLIGFKPEDVGFRLKGIDVKEQTALFYHDTYVLPKRHERLIMVYKTKDGVFSIFKVHTHGRDMSDPNIVGAGLIMEEITMLKNKSAEHLYIGKIHTKAQFAEIMKGALKFKLFDNEVVICTTDEKRKMVLDVYLTLDVPKEYKQELIFKDRMQYPVETFPNFRWCYSRQEQKQHWESPCTRKANSYLMACKDPSTFPPWETPLVLPLDEFIRRLKNHERGD